MAIPRSIQLTRGEEELHVGFNPRKIQSWNQRYGPERLLLIYLFNAHFVVSLSLKIWHVLLQSRHTLTHFTNVQATVNHNMSHMERFLDR